MQRRPEEAALGHIRNTKHHLFTACTEGHLQCNPHRSGDASVPKRHLFTVVRITYPPRKKLITIEIIPARIVLTPKGSKFLRETYPRNSPRPNNANKAVPRDEK